MTEEEKIMAGCMFNNRAPELVQCKRKAHRACLRFNQLDESDPERQPILKNILASIGDVYYFQGPLQFNYGCHTHIGNNFFANFNLTVMDDGPIYIGDNVCLGPNVSLMATNHPLLAQERLGLNPQGKMTMAEYAKGIHIGNNVWIASNVIVIDDVHIGNNVVIGAGSVVTQDIPDHYLAYGNPCRPVRLITEKDSQSQLILPEDQEHFKYNLSHCK